MVSPTSGRRGGGKTYTLKEAGQHLGIDQKTLRRKMDLLGLSPKPSDEDKRALLLTLDQVDLLASHLRRMPSGNVSALQEMALQIVMDREREWRMRSEDLQRHERDLMAEIEQLRREVQALRAVRKPSTTSAEIAVEKHAPTQAKGDVAHASDMPGEN
ncbi:MAG: hypothetical protein OJF49_002792 [Ktedonobacterales bacterium]|jgi:hypothetical protein|nr:MAG: hypothetical protein OJF49_002792 [Ktedonobacterales bacterium]